MNTNNKTCERCQRTFTTRANLLIHTKRLVPCAEKEIEQTNEVSPPSKKFKCNRCECTFQTNQNLNVHLNRKFPCELKNPSPEEIELRLLFEQLKRENEQQQAQIEQLQPHTTTTNSDNSVKNNINSNNSNSTTNNITINSYGNEDLSHISGPMFKRCFQLFHESVDQLFIMKHFSEQMQGNHNLYISNMRDAHMMMNRSGKWDVVNKSATLKRIYYNLKDDLSAAFDKMKSEKTIDPQLIRSYAPFIDEEINEEREARFKRTSCDKLACMAYNNRHFPMAIKAQMDKDAKKS